MVWEAVGTTVGGAFLSASLQVLFDRMASRQFLDFFREQQFDHHLWQKLKLKLLAVNSVLVDAEEQQIMNLSIKEWLDQLKDAVYDAEDLLDEIETEALKYKMEDEYQPPADKVNDLNTRLEEIFGRVNLIAEEKDILSLNEGVSQELLPKLPTTGLVNESEVCFRSDEKEEIVQFLLSDNQMNGNGNGISVIAIIGMGGIGKTTLAQFVYNDERVRRRFNLTAWVHVSERCNVFKMMESVYESAMFRQSGIKDLNVLQVKLERILMRRKFLIVLDDIWNGSFTDWDLLQRSFQAGAPGSKVMVTTRSQNVSSAMRSVRTFPLTPLSDEHCLSIFAKHAFGDEHQIDGDSTLKSIGEKIVEKCKGLPLAARTLGGLLHSKLAVEEWDRVLHSKIWDLPSGKSEILPALRLSYYHLPSYLKRCFAYCSIFPKGYEIKKVTLVRLWIAEGLVPQQNGTRRMEEVGEQYFKELLSRSFFQQSSHDDSCFKMHDLINDLAQHIAGDFYFRVEDGFLPLNPERIRHLSFITDRNATPANFEDFYEDFKQLRTFLPLKSPNASRVALSPSVFDNLFPESSRLRALSLSPYHITALPNSIGNLKHLRYLDLSRTQVQNLPARVCSLYNLQTLNLWGCFQLSLLPSNMQNLTKLEHLDIEGTSLKSMPLNFGKLKNLQLLTTFVVNKYSGSRLGEVKDLSLLCGTLSILRLQNLPQTKDASEANLKDKKYLHKLVLKWEPSYYSDSRFETEVLDKLRPHEYLKELHIEHFGGTKFPDWLGEALFCQMKSLHLLDCSYCSSLPPLGQLPRLQELHIARMKRVKEVTVEFYGSGSQPFQCLQILQFQEMPNWVDWYVADDAGFPSLKKLTMRHCPKLVGVLPTHLFSSVTLDINECRNLKFHHQNGTSQNSVP